MGMYVMLFFPQMRARRFQMKQFCSVRGEGRSGLWLFFAAVEFNALVSSTHTCVGSE